MAIVSVGNLADGSLPLVGAEAHGDTNYSHGDGTFPGRAVFYSQIISRGFPGSAGADLVLIAPKNLQGGVDYDIHIVPEQINGVLGTGVCFIDTDVKVSEYQQAPFRGHGLRILQQDNSVVWEWPISGGVMLVSGKLQGLNGGKNFVTRIGTATGFFIIEKHDGSQGIFQVDDNGNVVADSSIFTGVGTQAAPVAVQYRVPAVLYQSGNFNTNSTSDVSITSFTLKGGTLGTAFSKIRVKAAGRQVTQNGSFNVKFGATVIFTVTPLAGENWWIEANITRVGSTAERVTGITVHNATVAAISSTPGETLANDILVDFRGSVTAGGTLNLDDVSIEYMSST